MINPRETKVWYPLGEGSESRIVADLYGTAFEKTVSIEAACELLPDEALVFSKQVEEAVAWLRDDERGTGDNRGVFVKGAWIANPFTLPDEVFHKHFCCEHWGLVTDNKSQTIRCKFAGRILIGFDEPEPIPIPDWCPKKEPACADPGGRG